MDIAALKAAAEVATPRPWQIGRLGDQKMSHVVDFGPPPKSPYMVLLEGTPANPQMGGFTGFGPSGVAHADDGSSEANAAYIALANPTSILSLIARLEALEEALRPFAKYAELREASNIFDDELICGIHGADGSATVTFGDFRKARAALEPVQS